MTITAVTTIDQADAPWARCMHDFLRSKQDRTGSTWTIVSYTSILRRFFRSGRDPALYTRADVEEFLHLPYRGQTVGPATRNQRLAAINSFYQFAGDWDYTAQDGTVKKLFAGASPGAHILYGQQPQPRHVLTKGQLDAFFAVIPKNTIRGARDWSLFWAYFCSARRLSELQQLRWGDIQETTFEDGRQGHIFKFRGKGKHQIEDSQELMPSCYDAIVDYLKLSGREGSIKADDPVWRAHGPLWDAQNKPLNQRSINRAIRLYAQKAGLEVAPTCHWFRHSSARERFRASKDVLAVQRTLRHASLAMTQKYLERIVEQDDPGAAELERRFLAR